MVRGSLREEGSCILAGFHGHGRPWEQGAATFRGEEVGEGRREWRKEWSVKNEKPKMRRWPAKLYL